MNELYTHTICISFRVLTLKVVMYFEPSLVGLNKLKCMCISYIIINPWLFAWIEIYEYFDEFINLFESVNAWCIFISMKRNVKCLKVIGLHNVGVKNRYSSLDNYMKIYFLNWGMKGIQVIVVFNIFVNIFTIGYA
jgi:hypothetical protein